MRVAIICARDFAEPETIRDVVRAAPPGVEYVIREKEAYRDPDATPPEPGKQHKTLPLIDLLREEGYEPIVMGLDPDWKGEWGDRRSEIRDERIKRESDRVLVFRTPQTKTLGAYVASDWVDALVWPHIRTIERGEAAKRKYQKGRPVA